MIKSLKDWMNKVNILFTQRLISINVTSATSDLNLNNYTTTGVYHCQTSMTNAPMTNHGTVFVEFNVGTPYQIYIPDNQSYYYKRWRNSTDNTWNSWVKIGS